MTAPALDALSVDVAALPEVAFPATWSREFRIHYEPAAHEAIARHAAETTDVELCGILVGRVQRDQAGPYLTITGAIRGEHAQNDGAQVKLTHETWDHIHREKDTRFPGEAIVGWYHTHPGFGIFLSGMDTFIQEFFFNGPAQIAHVIDPRTGEEGVFTWRDGKVERSSRFWVGEREVACATGPIDSRQAPVVAPQLPASPDAHELPTLGTWPAKALLVAVGLLVGFLAARALSPFELQLVRGDLVRAEIRDLVGQAAQAWSSSDDLGAVEGRLDKALADLASVSPDAVARATRDLEDLQTEVVELRSAALAREDALERAIRARAASEKTIEEQIRAVARESASARTLALEAYLAILRGRIDALGKALTAKEKALLRESLESALVLEPSARNRQLLRSRFPELLPSGPVQSQAPAASSGLR